MYQPENPNKHSKTHNRYKNLNRHKNLKSIIISKNPLKANVYRIPKQQNAKNQKFYFNFTYN